MLSAATAFGSGPAVAEPAGIPDVPSLTAATIAPRLDLDSVTPAVLTPKAPVTIRGRVTSGTKALTAPRVEVTVAAVDLLTRADVREWVNDTSTTAVSGRTIVQVTPSVADALSPQSSATFTLRLPADVVGLPERAYGVLPLAITLTTQTAGARRTTIRTTLTYHVRKEYQPLTLGWLAAVTLPASPGLTDPDAQAQDEAWAEAVGPGSRVDRLLRGTREAPVSYAVDPSLFTPAPPLDDSNEPADGEDGEDGESDTDDGGADGGDGQSAAPSDVPTANAPGVAPSLGAVGATGSAQELASDLRGRLVNDDRHPVWALPPADADIAALTANGARSTTARDLLTGAQGFPGADRSVVVWPHDGGYGATREQRVTALLGSPPTLAVVSSSVLPGRDGFTTGALGRTATTRLLGFDDRLSAAMGRVTNPSQAVLTTQRLLAESLAILSEAPGTGQQLLVAIPRDTNPDAEALARLFTDLSSAPWLRMTTADDLLDGAPELVAVKTTASTWAATARGQAKTPLTSTTLRQLDRQRTDLLAVTSVLSLGAEFSDHWTMVSEDLLSTRWRGRPTAWRTVDQGLLTAVGVATSGIRVLPQRLNFLADSGSLQVTVVNDLDDPVSGLLLVLEPANARMQILSDPPEVSIAANSRVTVRVRARAVASGLVPIRARLTTVEDIPIGAETELVVRANPPSPWLYWVAGGGAALVFVGGVARAARRGKRDLSSAPPAEDKHVG